MATERQSPDAISVQTNLAGAVTTIQDDPDAPDTNWQEYGGAGNTICLVTFPTPTGAPTTGAGVQGFRVQIRKDATGDNDPDYSLQLYESGSQVGADLATGTLTDDDLDPGVVVEGTWDAAGLVTADGSAVECRVEQTGGGSGNPSKQRGVEIGAIEWNVDYTVSVAVTATGALGRFAASRG